MIENSTMSAKDKIACIGWGSLIWDKRDLPVAGDWQPNGPLLPVEFGRESSKDGKISLVLCAETSLVRTYSALLDVADIQAAKEALAKREGIENPAAKGIGFWDSATNAVHGREQQAIMAWAKALELKGVVWTNLTCGFQDRRGQMPKPEEIVAYLQGLGGDKLEKAKEYVCKAPLEIDTPYRRFITEKLGWRL